MRVWRVGMMVAGAALVTSALAQEMTKPKPEIKSVRPIWVPNGKPATLKVLGQDLAPKGVAFTDRKVAAKVVKVEKLDPKTDEEKAKGNTAVEIEVSAPAGLKPDSYAFKLVHGGEAQPEGKVYIDDDAPELEEKEPNDTLRKPQPVAAALPLAITGKLDNEGVDVFRFDGKAGEVWRIEILAARAGAGWEPALRLRDTNLVSVKVAVDEGNDCAMEYKFPKDGPYTLEVFDGDNRANKEYFYRLTVKRLSPAPAPTNG